MTQTNTKPYKEYKVEPVETIVSKPTHDQLHEALMFIQDILERSTIEFFLLGETAVKMYKDEMPTFDMDKIHIGVTRPHYHRDGASMLNTLLDESHVTRTITDKGLLLDYKGVPIQIDIINKYYPFFFYPDFRNYTITEFKIPNPMTDYVERMYDVE